MFTLLLPCLRSWPNPSRLGFRHHHWWWSISSNFMPFPRCVSINYRATNIWSVVDMSSMKSNYIGKTVRCRPSSRTKFSQRGSPRQRPIVPAQHKCPFHAPAKKWDYWNIIKTTATLLITKWILLTHFSRMSQNYSNRKVAIVSWERVNQLRRQIFPIDQNIGKTDIQPLGKHPYRTRMCSAG